MFICECCGDVSKPRQPRHTHAIQRTVPETYGEGTRTEIAKEYQVCTECKSFLTQNSGLAFTTARRVMCNVRAKERGQEAVPAHSNGKKKDADWIAQAVKLGGVAKK